MLIRSHPHRGFKLIDLMVVVLVIGVFFGLLIPAIEAAREAGRRVHCSNNLRQLALSLINFTASKNQYPNAGTFFDDPAIHGGDPARSIIARSIENPAAFKGDTDGWRRSWVIDIIPYLDSNDVSNGWDRSESYLSTTNFGNLKICSGDFGVLRCPDDTTTTTGQGNLSYVVNGGFSRWHAIPLSWNGGKADGQSKNGGALQWIPPGGTWQETQAVSRKLGVMFLGTSTGDQPWDIVTGPNDIPDGSSETLLLAENTLAGYSPGTPYSGGIPTNWACPLPNFCMFIASDDVCRSARSTTDCLAGSLKPDTSGKDGTGWAWANRPGTYENIGYGQNLRIEGSFPFASSGHPGGGNFVFCDGATRFLSDSIDGTVYAKMISPAGSQLPTPLLQGPLARDSWEQAP
ncbi:prepilin-type processing-associated H-X9-DG domain-containing protein [Singulisphaera sp. GP187]|uniref:DUF1559 family PulG-like putative transporter n=1 Tax=Singulisphaera sp. GP187 TaxID=1882752 RepID=UPI000928FEEC|nr:DUF1559 domain-containing protein [Singulisphaera sp. GP187]SIO62875.1 prepilin-type processing-associated H-X9-DG domain-containing protein [Singulisphaera sp. GP187]